MKALMIMVLIFESVPVDGCKKHKGDREVASQRGQILFTDPCDGPVGSTAIDTLESIVEGQKPGVATTHTLSVNLPSNLKSVQLDWTREEHRLEMEDCMFLRLCFGATERIQLGRVIRL